MLFLDIYLIIGTVIGLALLYVLDAYPDQLIQKGAKKELVTQLKQDLNAEPHLKVFFIGILAVGWLPMFLIPSKWMF